MAATGLISVFETFPKELFRVNNGRYVKIRAQQPGRYIYDIISQNGRVEPKALNPETYIGLDSPKAACQRSLAEPCLIAPNGASLRPNSPYQQSLVSTRFRGPEVVVYGIAKGSIRTPMPPDGDNITHWDE